MTGNQFDLSYDKDQITVEHHVRNERLLIERDGNEWVARSGPIDGTQVLTKHGAVETRADAWECVLHWVDHGEVFDGD